MKLYDGKKIKNIILLGGAKSGKTTLAETMLYEAGLITRRGTVEDNNTISDYHALEHERGSSVFTSLLHTEWRNYKINILDTPGDFDFIGEIIPSVRVADTCVYVVNSQQGFDIGIENIWNIVDQYKKPTLFAINQIDHPQSKFYQAVKDLETHLGNAVTLVQYPLSEGEGFEAIIDLLKMKMYKFGPDGGKPEKLEIPESETERANKLHIELVEKAAENDDGLMERYFEQGNLDEDELRKGLKIGMLNHDIFPVFVLSAKRNMGSGRMMGFIDNVAPSAIDALPEISTEDKEIAKNPDGPTGLFVYKTQIEPNLGQMSFFKVESGELKEGMELINHQKNKSERINQLFVIDGHKREEVQSLSIGDIGATLKLKYTDTNDTLRNTSSNEAIAPMVFPAPRMTIAIVANTKSDQEKLGDVLQKIHAQDPTVIIEFNNELKQLLISCQGQTHLSVIKWQIENEYKLDVTFESPRIPYRETIHKSADQMYRHKKQSGGAGQFAEVHLKVETYTDGMSEPTGMNIRGKQEIELDWGGKLIFYNCIVGGVIDGRYIPSIVKGILEIMQEGPLIGSHVRDVRVMLYDGKMHPVDSNDIAFKIAGMKAFKQAFMNADPRLMEPIHELNVKVHEELMGEVMTDLQTRRAIIMGIDTEGNNHVIKAKAPLAELGEYATSLHSITHGSATFTNTFKEFSVVPLETQKALIEEHEHLTMKA